VPFTVERLDARNWTDEQVDPVFDGAFPGPLPLTADPVAVGYVENDDAGGAPGGLPVHGRSTGICLSHVAREVVRNARPEAG
jgi:hypothetical protein